MTSPFHRQAADKIPAGSCRASGQKPAGNLSRLDFMSAQPIHQEPDPRDPQTILRELPAKVRPKFLAEYRAAVDVAHDPAGYRALQDTLQTWRLLAAAYAKPDFHQRYQDIRDGVGEYVPMDEVFAHRNA